MYSIWILAAGGLLIAWMGIRKLLRGRAGRNLSPFQQARPVPDLSHSGSTLAKDGRSSVQGVSADTATSGEGRPRSVDPLSITLPPISREPVTVAASSGDQTTSISKSSGGTHSGMVAAAASIPTAVSDAYFRGDRRSTWSDRRLFQDFQGILSDGGESLPLPAPEDLPVPSDEYVFGTLTPPLAQLLPESDARREIQRKSLTAAGYHSRAAWVNLSAVRFTLAFLSMVIVGFWLVVAPPAFEPWLMGLLILAPLLMWALPPLIVAYRASERKIDIEHGIPDVLDMMNMGVSQGLTVPQSLKRISSELSHAHPALAEELRIVNHQTEVGSLPQALRNFSQRIDSPAVSSFTSLLVQSEVTGTSISSALTAHSDSIRATLKERADAQANAASFKLLFPVALLLMPSVFLFLLGPAIVQMSDFFNSQVNDLDRNRQNALQSLDQQPQLNFDRFNQPGGAFGGGVR